MKKEEGKKVKPDALLKGGKKGTAELSEDQLKGVTGGSLKYNTNIGTGHQTNSGGSRQNNN